MKSIENFAAQQLSKKQMNDVKGGGYMSTVRYGTFMRTKR